jgi:hypothetical protein
MAAEAELEHSRFVAPTAVLTWMGWLQSEHAANWRRGRAPHLERVTVASLSV